MQGAGSNAAQEDNGLPRMRSLLVRTRPRMKTQAEVFIVRAVDLLTFKFDWELEWAPWGGQRSGGRFDHRPGVAILELLGAG